MGFYNGPELFTQKDADVAKCLVDLHANQDSACITKAGSSCDLNDSQLARVVEVRLSGSHQLSAENAEAIRAAIQAAADQGITWDRGEQSIQFAQEADNGSSVRGVSAIWDSDKC